MSSKGSGGGDEVELDGVVLFYRGWLSQWYPSKFRCEETKRSFLCAEQYMMAEKARLFGDRDTEKKIMQAKHPRQHKELGRSVKGFDQKVWEENCSEIVFKGSMLKFSQNPNILKQLLATGDKRLAEASPTDCVWGIGLAADHPDAPKPDKWRGKNLLGQALERARTALAKTNQPPPH